MTRRAIAVLLLALVARDAAADGVVEALRAAGATLHPLGREAGLEGYWVEPDGGAGYPFYVTPSGHGVLGLLHDAEGRLVTSRQIAAAGLAAAPAARSLDPAIGAAAFALGSGGPDIVVFADPACPWSRSTVARLAMAALEGHLVLHVVPVALLGGDSARMALAVVAAADPAAAWFDGRTASGETGGGAELAANNRLFARHGGGAVPLALRATPEGIEAHEGAIDDPVSWLGGPDR